MTFLGYAAVQEITTLAVENEQQIPDRSGHLGVTFFFLIHILHKQKKVLVSPLYYGQHGVQARSFSCFGRLRWGVYL